MSAAEVHGQPKNGQSSYGLTDRSAPGKEKPSGESIDDQQTTDAEDKYQGTLETVTKKLREKKLSADFTHYELKMIWEAAVEDLQKLLHLSSDDDIEFLQSLCCDLFLYDDNYRDAPTMDELLKKEEDWRKKLTCNEKPHK